MYGTSIISVIIIHFNFVIFSNHNNARVRVMVFQQQQQYSLPHFKDINTTAV